MAELTRKDVTVSAKGVVRVKAKRDAERTKIGTVQRYEHPTGWRGWDFARDGKRPRHAWVRRSAAVQALLDEVNRDG